MKEFKVVSRKVVPFEKVHNLLIEIDKLQEKINNLKLNTADKTSAEKIKILEEIVKFLWIILEAEKYLCELYNKKSSV